MSRDSEPQNPNVEPGSDDYIPAPDELEEPEGDSHDPTGEAPGPEPEYAPEPEENGYEDRDRDNIHTYEQDYMAKGMIVLFVVVVGFMFGVWALQWELLEKQAAREEVAHPITTAVSGLHRAMHGQGIFLHQDAAPGMADWLNEKLGDHARLPDLSPAGLRPVGVRDLKTGTGFGFIHYRGTGGDLLLVLGPKDMILVPADAVARTVSGSEIWLQETPVLRLVYVPGTNADWALVAAPGEADLPAVAEVLLAALR